MLLHKKRPLAAKPLTCLIPTSELEFVVLSIVLTQLFSEHAIKQITGIILVKMKTPPLLQRDIFNLQPQKQLLSAHCREQALQCEESSKQFRNEERKKR